MQNVMSLGNAIYRIVFRGGSPQRIQYSDALLIVSISVFIGLSIVCAALFFRSSIIEIGLLLFTCLSGIYIGAALMTRKSPRSRLRTSLVAIFLILIGAEVALTILTPFAREVAALRPVAIVVIGVAVLVGATNVLHYALGSSRTNAALLTLLFAASLGAFYSIMQSLLETVFS